MEDRDALKVGVCLPQLLCEAIITGCHHLLVTLGQEGLERREMACQMDKIEEFLSTQTLFAAASSHFLSQSDSSI